MLRVWFRALQTTFKSAIDFHSLSCSRSQSEGKLSALSLHNIFAVIGGGYHFLTEA
jgi:hypothetical protein